MIEEETAGGQEELSGKDTHDNQLHIIRRPLQNVQWMAYLHPNQLLEEGGEGKGAEKHGPEEQKEEELVIAPTDTIVKKNAVMIHLENTAIAGGAMMTAIGLERITHGTMLVDVGWQEDLSAIASLGDSSNGLIGIRPP